MFSGHGDIIPISQFGTQHIGVKIKAWLFDSGYHLCSFGGLPLPRKPQEWGHATLIGQPSLAELPFPLQGKGRRAFVCIVVPQNAQRQFCIQKCIVRVILPAEIREGNPINRTVFKITG